VAISPKKDLAVALLALTSKNTGHVLSLCAFNSLVTCNECALFNVSMTLCDLGLSNSLLP